MILFFKKNAWFFAGMLILVWVIYANLFPKGYVLAGGDVKQFINANESFKSLFFEWQGRAILFYVPFLILSKIGISETIQLSFYLAIFIFGSYISFDLFVRMICKSCTPLLRMCISLFYALNIYTLYIYSYNWGYSYYQSLYIAVPILTGLYLKFIIERKNIFAVLFALVIFFASSGFGNPAFALSFSILLLLLTFFLITFKLTSFDKDLFGKIISLFLISLLVNAYWIIPTIPTMRGGVESLFSGNIIDLNWWLKHTSNPISDTLRLMQYNNWYFPDNFPYAALYKYRSFFEFLTILPIFLIVAGLFFIEKISIVQRKYYILFSILLAILTMFIAKVRPPFEVFNQFFYHIWGINTLRGYEKFAIFTPFVFSVLLLFAMQAFSKKTILKILAFSCLFLILVTPLPFYLGKLHQNMSAVFVRDTVSLKEKDYKIAKYSFLVKIPEQYYDIKNVVNDDSADVQIATLPYNVVDSISWSNYEKWKLMGADITSSLYNKRFIDANTDYFGGWFYGKDLNETEGSQKWVVELLGMMNAKYIIYHKDVEPQFLEKSKEKITELQNEGLLELIAENDYFNLYEIRSDLIFPLITFQEKEIEISKDAQSIEENFSKIKSNVFPIEFRKISPKKYEIEKTDFKKGNIVLAYPFDPNWRAYVKSSDGRTLELKDHFRARGYANGWKVDEELSISKIVIEYYPMKLAYYGIAISLLTLFIIIIYLLNYVWKNRN